MLITAIESFEGGFRITTDRRGVFEVLETDVPTSVRRNGAQAVEDWINSRLDAVAATDQRGRHFYATVHVYSLNPMILVGAVSRAPLSAGWWDN